MTEVFNEIIKSLNYKELKTVYLLNKAKDLPYCKRNIIEAKILFWSFVYNELTQRILLGIKNPHRKLNINEECKQFLLENNLANPKVLEFFFNMHEALTCAFLDSLEKELSNGHKLEEKMKLIEEELLELLNIALIELEGLSVDCKAFGCSPICPKFQETGISECEARGVDNVVTIYINPEYFRNEKIVPGILSSIEKLKNSKDIILIVDYRNICSRMAEYNWDGVGAWERYLTCKNHVKEIYFYKAESCVDFGSRYNDLKHLIIPDKASKDKLIKSWKNKKELIYF